MKYLEQATRMISLWIDTGADVTTLPYAISAFAEHTNKLQHEAPIVDYKEHVVRLLWLAHMSRWSNDVLVEAVTNLIHRAIEADRDGTGVALKETTGVETTPLFLMGYNTYVESDEPRS